MSEIQSKPDHFEVIVEPAGLPTIRFQLYLDDIAQWMNSNLLGEAVILPEYTVLTVPTASDWDNGAIIVSDETGGRTIATSDGTNWRRVSDGAVVS